MTHHNVTLVAAIDRLQRDFPGNINLYAGGRGILSGVYQVNPSACRTALGGWLAATVQTTLFVDDAARCSLLLNATEEGLHVRALAERLLTDQVILSLADAERVYQQLEHWVADRRAYQASYGTVCYLSCFCGCVFPGTAYNLTIQRQRRTSWWHCTA